MKTKRVLIIYYSFSSQSRNLINHIAQGLVEEGVQVQFESIRPLKKRKFPIGTYTGTLKLMGRTFLRRRDAIERLSSKCQGEWDLVILGGPTWSFNPSGPILSLLDREKAHFFKEKKVLPLISCRSLWRIHYYSLRWALKRYVEKIYKPVVFYHTVKEPWCTIGLFLKLAGRMPESWKSRWSHLYPRYGHTRKQHDLARDLGTQIAKNLHCEGGIENLQYDIPFAEVCRCRSGQVNA